MALPTYSIFPDVLQRFELAQLKNLAKDPIKQIDSYRTRLWEEQFKISDHKTTSVATPILDKLASIFLDYLNGLGYNTQKVFFDASIDRTICFEEGENDLFWHQDEMITPNGHTKTPHFTMALLISRNDGKWEGGNLVLQHGGQYVDEKGRPLGSSIPPNTYFEWKNSQNPLVEIVPKYNQAVIFRNDNAGHKVTRIIPKTCVTRDAFLLSCYIQK